MSPLFILVLVVQVILIVHCIRTGRNTLWIWVLALLSFAGAIAYVAVELIPDLFRSSTARNALRGVRVPYPDPVRRANPVEVSPPQR